MTKLKACLLLALAAGASAQPFVHPGILQTRGDLDFMKAKVAAGEQPWKQAWDNLLGQPYSSPGFEPRPVAHIARGAFGRASQGDRDLSDSAQAAYSQALQWYVTGDRAHARRAIRILNAWSAVLWDFEGNDAKLLAGWTGGAFCNAAEILRATDSGWDTAGVTQFRRMMLTVYYPLLRDFFPEANGNWDAAIIDSLLSIGIFCDDRAIFGSAVEHFLRGPGNGGVTKYVYPNGQCDENARDQGHTQLGLGYFARAAAVAWNQGVDLWSTAGDRLALGFEYTAKYVMGEDVPAYGTLSPAGRGRLSDIYEPVYQHYHFAKGLDTPYTERAIQGTRERGWAALVMYRGTSGRAPAGASRAPAAPGPAAGAQSTPGERAPADAVTVAAGESIQEAIDRRAAAGGGWVVLAKGLHTLPAALRIPSGITLAGQGRETIVFLDPKAPVANAGIAIVNASDDLHDVTLRDFAIEASTVTRVPTDPNQDRRVRSYQSAPVRGGVRFSAQRTGEMRNLRMERVTVRNATHNAVAILGAAGVSIVACDFSESGSSVVPGPGLEHNLLLTRVNGAEVRDSRFDRSPWGSGIDVSFSRDVTLANNEIARNRLYGVRVSESEDVRVTGNLAEGNDAGGIVLERLFDGSRGIVVRENVVRNNGGAGIDAAGAIEADIATNTGRDNGRR
ncbi:MAG: alginate lyase family protein [Acidobacteria bacterium]|nr:alginate lyase family protein [Acidobacteriota bacterium]